MSYTPYGNHSDEELLLAVANRDDATDLEIELAQRLERLMQELEEIPEPGCEVLEDLVVLT